MARWKLRRETSAAESISALNRSMRRAITAVTNQALAMEQQREGFMLGLRLADRELLVEYRAALQRNIAAHEAYITIITPVVEFRAGTEDLSYD